MEPSAPNKPPEVQTHAAKETQPPEPKRTMVPVKSAVKDEKTGKVQFTDGDVQDPYKGQGGAYTIDPETGMRVPADVATTNPEPNVALARPEEAPAPKK